MNIVFTPYGWEKRIREGELSGQLLRPIHPIHFDLANFAGWKVVVIVLWLPIAVVLSLVFHPTLESTAPRAPSSAFAIWGAYLIRSLPWLLGHGHVLDHPGRARVRGLLRRRAAALGPARAARAHAGVGPDPRAGCCRSGGHSASRSQALVGRLSGGELLGGLAMQVLWITIGAVSLRFVWRLAVRRYSAVNN